MKRSPIILAASVSLLAGLASGQNPPDARDALYNQGPKPEAVGDSVMVSTQLPIVTETRAGGAPERRERHRRVRDPRCSSRMSWTTTR